MIESVICMFGMMLEVVMVGVLVVCIVDVFVKLWWLFVFVGVVVIVFEGVIWVGLLVWLLVVFVFVVVFVCGFIMYKKGWIVICNGNLNINVLMSIVVMGVMVIG